MSLLHTTFTTAFCNFCMNYPTKINPSKVSDKKMNRTRENQLYSGRIIIKFYTECQFFFLTQNLPLLNQICFLNSESGLGMQAKK